MDFDFLDLYRYYNDRPLKSICKALRSFFRSRYYRQAIKELKIQKIRYLFCHAKWKSNKILAYYVMGTKRKPMIVLHDRALKHYSKKIGKGYDKSVVYAAMLHEMGHAWLDYRGLDRQSEKVVTDFSYKALEIGVPKAMRILKKYLKRRGK